MTEIKPVYQWQHSNRGVLPESWWKDCTEEDFNARDNKPQFNSRILYPAAAYESLQKENAELKAIISNLTKAYERESNDSLKYLEERDYWYNKLDALAEKISECFEVPIGEHSNVNCPFEEAMKVLCGEYVTKFDKESAAQAKRIADLEAAVKANHEWHQEHDDYDGCQESELCTINSAALGASKTGAEDAK